MKSLYLLITLSFCYGDILAQSFSDPNFSVSTIVSGWTEPVGAAFSKDAEKLFVWEKAGFLYVCNKSGASYVKQTTPVIDLTAEVLNWRDHGLMGFALDPDFATNGYIYLLYIVDRRFLMNNNSIVADAGHQATIARLTKYKTILSGGNLVVDPSTRNILIGESPSTGIAAIHESHVIGSLAFAADGTLLVSTGDGASYYLMDAGSDSDTYWEQAIQDGILRPAENVGAFRSQILNCHNGKLLRIDPNTGNGVSSNPYYSAAEPRAAKSRVWAMGFRNAFRMLVKPGTGSTNPHTGDIGEVYVGDVGWSTWEEFSIITGPGMNCGWPVYEGHEINSQYNTKATTLQNMDEPNPLAGQTGCSRPYFTFRELIKNPTADENKTINNPCNSSVPIGTGTRYVHRRPAIDFKHEVSSSRVGIFSGNTAALAEIGTPASGVIGTPFAGNCALAGVWYTGNNFPPDYKNTFLLVDQTARWIKRFTIDYTDVITRVDNLVMVFANITSLAENPVDGTLAAVDIVNNSIKKIQYGGNQPPVAVPKANVIYGVSPLTVNFTGNTSYDLSPGGSIASYSWNFGGGSPSTSTTANPTGVVFTDATGNPKKFVVKLTVTDNGGATDVDSVIISVNNTPPVVNITSPVKNSTYSLGGDAVYNCTATVTDNEHTAAQLKYEWQTILRHNSHEHPEPIDNNVTTTTRISRIGCNGDNYYWMIKLKVTDAAGLSTTDSSKIFPACGSDNIPPVVTSITPANAATGVNINTTITADFNENIDASTVTNTTFQLKDAGNNIIPAQVITSSNEITLTPSSALAGSTVHTVTVKGGASGVKDLAGNPLAGDYSWTFTTVAVDNIPPTVTSVLPVHGSTGISTGTTLTATFSEAINASTVTGTTFQLRDAGNNLVTATINVSGSQATLTPSSALTGSTVYTVTITGGASGIKDLAGNALVNNYSWSFTTVAVDNTPPTITSVSPVNGAIGVTTGITVIANFSEAMNASTVTGTTFQLRDAGNNLVAAVINASGTQVTLTPSSALTGSTVYTVTITGGITGVKDLAGNALGSNYVWSFTTTNVDNTPPTVLSVFPASGATGISVGTTVTANFSEAINASTVSTSTFQLRNPANTLITATVSTSGNQITLTPSAALANSTAYTATITGGASGVKDLAGNALAVNYSWTFTTITAGGGGSVTIFLPTSTPQTPLANDGQGITLGVKFRSSQNGFITGVRYYKGAGTTGTHTGQLWSRTGTQLAAATFTGETASGWQQVLFASPIAITANTTYVATYFSPSGQYAASKPYFTQAVVNGVLTALADGTDGPNGLFRYGSSVGFPSTGFQSSNYWVDIVFNTSGGNVAPSVTTQPTSQIRCAGTNASFTSAASGTPAPTVQWQQSTNGTTWTNVTGATSPTLSFVTTTADNNKQYRAAWTNSVSTVNSNAAILTVNPIPATPSVNVANNCGNSVLTATGFTGSLLWSNGATASSITVTAGGTYTVTQTVNGCTSGAGTGIAAPLSGPAAPSVAVVNNCGSSVLTASGFTGSLLWSNGATTSSITVTTGGTYTVTQTVNGCTSAAGGNTAAPKAIPSAPNVAVANNCGSSVLTASGFIGSLLWSNGATTASITVTTAGTYTVTQTINGCTSVAGSNTAAPLNSQVDAPIVIVDNNCGNSILTASGYTGSLLWSNGATTASITVNTPGTYTVTQTLNGCTSPAASGVATPVAIPPAPVVSVSNNCGSSVLTASGFTGSLLWNTGETSASISVTNPATYTATQTVSGCTSTPGSNIAAPKAIPSAPGVTVVDNCGSSVLTASGFTGSLLWSTGAITNPISVTTAGIYTVTQTVNGCTSTEGSGNASPLNSSVDAPTVEVINNCDNSVLTASGFTGSLQWSNGATTESITVTTGGTYTVTQTINSCTSPPGTGVAAPVNSTIPAPSVAVANNCGGSILTASGFTGSLLWNTGETTASVNVTVAGTYTVTQTVSGCTSNAGSGIAAPKSIPATPSVNVTNNCGSSVLTATGVTGTLLWSNGATTNPVTVTTAGIYTVTQTVNGCVSEEGSGTAAPTGSTVTAPSVNVTNNCTNSVLTASGFTGTLLWSNGATTNSITVTTAGTYTVTQTISGCTSPAGSGTATPVNTTITAPAVAVANNCGNSVLTASGFTGSLLWSNGATSNPVTVTTAGTYTVTQTIDGCTGPARSVTAAPKAVPVLSSNLTATATSGTAFTYTATSATGGTTFAWSRAAVTGISNAAASGTGNINETLVNTTALAVNVTYVYTLTANGCVNTQNLVVTVNPATTINCVINGAITSSFNSTSIPAGRYIWFSSVFDRGSLNGVTGTVTFNVTNSVITFTANSVQYTLNVPDSRIRYDAAVTSATTQFINNIWETAIPRNYNGYVFMGGLRYQVPANLPGNITNVRWTTRISIDKTNVSLTWKWAAATYTNLAVHSGLNIKPKNGNTQNPYNNNDNAGTPENYKSFLVSGAKGTGGTNYTGSYSSTSNATCTVTAGQRSSAEPVTALPSLNSQVRELSAGRLLNQKLEVSAVPNPSNTFFNLIIKGNNKNPVSVRIIDLFGKLVEQYEKIGANSTLQVGNKLTGGSYFIEVIQDDQRKYLKIIKIN